MDRPTLKRNYNLAIAAALSVGFAIGYTLRNPEVTGANLPMQQARDFEQDFPGCSKTFRQLSGLMAMGDEVRSDYDGLLEKIREAVEKDPGYVPYAVLRSAIWEDWMCNLNAGRYDEETKAMLARRVGLPENASLEEVAEGLRKRAIEAWLAVEESPLVKEPEKYGERWNVLLEQHLNALRQQQKIRTPMSENGMADLARAYNVYALTRDFVRYPNNLSDDPSGFSFEEKHVQDAVYCPRHREVAFQLPCLAYLEPNRGGTIRRSLEMYRTGIRITGQKLNIEPMSAEAMHLLVFNTTSDRHVVDAQCRILYSDGEEVVEAFKVPPWRQSEELLRDVEARLALDAVHRDSEVHLANGSELNLPSSPFYMYHAEIKLDPKKRVDEIYFPRHDPTSAGLEDPGIDDVCIVALTLK